MAIDETGGSHGVRDLSAILSIENSPKQKVFGKELYPTVFLKAGLYARNIIQNHPFLDGNKRTGMIGAFVFLEDNGYMSIAKEGEIYAFALEIIKEKLGVEAIAAWFAAHSKCLKITK